MQKEHFIHMTAEVHPSATINEGTKIWNWVQVREHASIGRNCVISKGAYIDFEVTIGDNVKIQNNASIYHGVNIEDGVFVGPHVCFTNDKMPRAINPDGSLKSSNDWIVSKTSVRYGASIGANSTIISGINIGKFSLIAAGSVVTKDVPDYGLVMGNPARLVGYVCKCGKKLTDRCNICNISLKNVQ
jgi:acetyltransferase-like isoleucine patch superfamily enzyme